MTSAIDIHPGVVRGHCKRLLLSWVAAHMLWFQGTYSQGSMTTFGPLVERSLSFMPVALTLSATPSGRREIAVASQDQPHIGLFYLDVSGRIEQAGQITTSRPQSFLTSLDIDADGRAEYIGLAADGSTVSVIKRTRTKYQERPLSTGLQAQRLIVCDINNDSRKDILLFGKSMAGVASFLGKPGDAFSKGPLLFPEISVSDIKTADVNGDGITDVFLLDWLANRFVLFYGITRSLFSEQVSIALPGEPGSLALAPGTRRRTPRAAVTLPADRSMAILSGDASGEFGIVQMIPVQGTPTGVVFADVNNDAVPDVVTGTDKGTMVSLAGQGNTYGSTVSFGVASPAGIWAVGDIDGDMRNDLVVAEEHARRLVIVGNADHRGPVRWSGSYAVGAGPRAVLATDLNGDGRTDLALVSGGASTVCLLLNRGDGRFSGQISFPVSEGPASLAVVASGSTGERAFVTAHPDADNVSVTSISSDMRRSTSFSMPTGSNPSVVFARRTSSGQGLEILVRSSSANAASVSLSLFEQISGEQFLERTLRVNLPERILALALPPPTPEGQYELLFVTNMKSARVSSLSVARARSDFAFSDIRTALTVRDSAATARMVRSEFLDDDPYRDAIIGFGHPRNALAIAFGTASGSFRDSLEWIRDIHPLNGNGLLVGDVDGDGHTDVTALDSMGEEVLVVYGLGKGRFGRRTTIAAAVGVTAIAVAPLRKPDVQDLVLVNGDRGIVSIVLDPFRR